MNKRNHFGSKLEKTYYTEYPAGQFKAKDDAEALSKSKAKVIYRESPTFDGKPFIMLRDESVKERDTLQGHEIRQRKDKEVKQHSEMLMGKKKIEEKEYKEKREEFEQKQKKAVDKFNDWFLRNTEE